MDRKLSVKLKGVSTGKAVLMNAEFISDGTEDISGWKFISFCGSFFLSGEILFVKLFNVIGTSTQDKERPEVFVKKFIFEDRGFDTEDS